MQTERLSWPGLGLFHSKLRALSPKLNALVESRGQGKKAKEELRQNGILSGQRPDKIRKPGGNRRATLGDVVERALRAEGPPQRTWRACCRCPLCRPLWLLKNYSTDHSREWSCPVETTGLQTAIRPEFSAVLRKQDALEVARPELDLLRGLSMSSSSIKSHKARRNPALSF
jgi:hypothetical protein